MSDPSDTSASKPPIRFFWWCKECGWWNEVDFGGLCADCRSHSDGKGRGATPDDRERPGVCRKCR
jgi:hypothetical protein